MGSSVGHHSLSVLVLLWALDTVNPCSQSFGSQSEELIPCENSIQKCTLQPTHSFFSLEITYEEVCKMRHLQMLVQVLIR